MRILLADDETKVRFALRVLLERQPGLEVVGEALNASEMLSQVAVVCPELVLLDWELPGLEGKVSLASLQQACPQTVVVALSGHLEAGSAALDAGADGFVCKCESPEHLLRAIRDCAPVTRLQAIEVH